MHEAISFYVNCLLYRIVIAFSFQALPFTEKNGNYEKDFALLASIMDLGCHLGFYAFDLCTYSGRQSGIDWVTGNVSSIAPKLLWLPCPVSSYSRNSSSEAQTAAVAMIIHFI